MILLPKNWAGFQHYKDRNPTWIKLHKSLLDDYEFQCLPVASRALAPMLWLLASEHKEGRIEGEAKKLAFRLRLTEKELAEALKPLIDGGFFIAEQSASTPLAEPERAAIPETERETEKRESRERATRFALDSLPDDWKAFCKQERPDLTPEKTFAAFSDYWKGAPGAKGRKLDWTATWRNWVRNEKRAPQSRADLVAPKPPPNVTGYTGPEFVAPTPETLQASKRLTELLRRNAA